MAGEAALYCCSGRMADFSWEVVDDGRVGDLCVVPWTYGEVAAWAEGTGATDPLSPRRPSAPRSNLDPLLEVALESLSSRVNLSTGLVHPSDKSAPIQMFRILAEARVSWDPAEVEAWTLGNRWTARGADQLRDVARGVRDGRRYRVGRSEWAPDILSKWKARSEPLEK